MKMQARLTRKNLIIALIVLTVTIATAGYFLLRRPAAVPMDRLVPASALAFLEIDNLPDLADGLTGTRCWRELGSALGLSSQLRQVGLMSDLLGRTGLGPDEAVIAGRAQFALALTDVETEAGKADEGPYLHFKPRVALIIETHSSAAVASRLVGERSLLIAQRIYGTGVVQEEQEYEGVRIYVFHGSTTDRQFVTASAGSVVVLANHIGAIRECLDSISGRAPSISADAALVRLKPEVSAKAAASAFVTATGVKKFIGLAPAFVASRYQANPDIVASFANLLEHLADQAVTGLLYWTDFRDNVVVDHYLTSLEPGIGAALAEALRPASGAKFASPELIPSGASEVTLINIDHAGEMPERALKDLAPHVDLVAGVALREFVVSLRKQYGIEGAESVGDAVGHEIALVNMGDGASQAMLIAANDRNRLAPFLARYLSRGKPIPSAIDERKELSYASDGEHAVAFVGGFLILATPQQVAAIQQAQSSGNSVAAAAAFRAAIASRPAGAAVLSVSPASKRAADLMLGISQLTRVTDGSRELLAQESVRRVIEKLPLSTSFTEFRDYGVYTETRSALGNFALIGPFLGSEAEE